MAMARPPTAQIIMVAISALPMIVVGVSALWDGNWLYVGLMAAGLGLVFGLIWLLEWSEKRREERVFRMLKDAVEERRRNGG